MNTRMLNRAVPFLLLAAINRPLAEAAPQSANRPVLQPDAFRHYVEQFNKDDDELYVNHVPNEKSWEFLQANIPLFECPDKQIEKTYYFRWWTFRKHIKQTSDGFVVTEFLPKVSWSGKDNTIDCPAGHHHYEGRWLRDPKYLDDYSMFWFRKGGNPRAYSFWAADAIWARYLVTGNANLAKDLLPDLIKNYQAWEKDHLDASGLFWQIDDRDGMECSIAGNGCRATINSYMFGDAVAISRIATLAGQTELARQFRDKAVATKKLVQDKLWDADAKFFKVLGRSEVKDGKVVAAGKLADVREEHGYTPWYFNLPDRNAGYEEAWRQLMDPKGFFAPYGPTTAEQRHPKFAVSYTGHGCQWNGPSWPFATAVTLTALANVLNNYPQTVISKADYFKTFGIYTNSHQLKREDGRIQPWIDENIDPFTGVWLARVFCMAENDRLMARDKAEKVLRERGKDYNHSTYCDLVISGLVGLRPRPDETVEVNPLVPLGTWDYFCLDQVSYHGRMLTILYDKTGTHYNQGRGLRIFADGRQIAASDTLARMTATLPPMKHNP